MSKGLKGETCSEALKELIGKRKVATADELFKRLKEKGRWTDDTIWQHLMGCVVNLRPAHQHWPHEERFLFFHGNGQYELYDPRKHGHWVGGRPLHKAKEMGPQAVYPWVAALSQKDREEFLTELLQETKDAVVSGNLEKLKETIESWQETAEILADKELMAGVKESEEELRKRATIPWKETKAKSSTQ